MIYKKEMLPEIKLIISSVSPIPAVAIPQPIDMNHTSFLKPMAHNAKLTMLIIKNPIASKYANLAIACLQYPEVQLVNPEEQGPVKKLVPNNKK